MNHTYPHQLHESVVPPGQGPGSITRELKKTRRGLVIQPPDAEPIDKPAVVSILLTTVSVSSNFDAYVHIGFEGTSTTESLTVDTGNANLVIPDFSVIEGNNAYTVLGEQSEPWGSPAKVVRLSLIHI